MSYRGNAQKLKDSGKVSGMILWNNGTDRFSTEDQCPNRYSGLKSEVCGYEDSWNSVGTALLLEDWGFPIAYVQDLESIKQLKEVSKHTSYAGYRNIGFCCATETRTKYTRWCSAVQCKRASEVAISMVNKR